MAGLFLFLIFFSVHSPYWFPDDGPDLHPHEQGVSFSFSTTWPGLLPFVLLILSILTGLRRSLKIVLMCVSLIAKDDGQALPGVFLSHVYFSYTESCFGP